MNLQNHRRTEKLYMFQQNTMYAQHHTILWSGC